MPSRPNFSNLTVRFFPWYDRLLHRMNLVPQLKIMMNLRTLFFALCLGLFVFFHKAGGRVHSPLLSSSVLEERLDWCAKNALHYRGCQAALRYLQEEAGIRMMQASGPKETFQKVRALLSHEQKAEAGWVSGALNAWIASLDPHARIVPAQDREKSVRNDKIQVNGAGVKLRFYKGRILVAYVMENSAAEAAGLQAGDEILTLNGHSFAGMNESKRHKTFAAAKAPFRVEGKRGKKRFSFQILAKKYLLPNVEAKLETDFTGKNIGQLRIRSFDKDSTCTEVRTAVEKLERDGAQQIQIDLRNNPGGLVAEARCVAGLFLGEGKVFAQLKESSFHEVRDLVPAAPVGKSLGKDGLLLTEESRLTDLPLTVEINQNTASAAEMVAAALQDNERAKIRGARSFGKGSMQSVFHPWDNQALYLSRTTYEIHRPSGKSLQYAGVMPDLVVETAEGENFPRERDLTQ